MAALVVAACLALAAPFGNAWAQAAEPIEQVAWLAGCWSADGGEAGSAEHWMPAAGGTMLGANRTVKNGKTVAFEFMQLRQNAEGRLSFIALPSGQRETPFVLKSSNNDEFVFENLAHDFPQRVIYRRLPDGKLAARIEGLRAGVQRGIDFPMTRTACQATATPTPK